MKKSMIKISFDKESEVLSLVLKKGRSVDSLLQGSAVLDVDKNGEVVRIDIHDYDFDAFRPLQKAVASMIHGHLRVAQRV